jgi:hypothetical protein
MNKPKEQLEELLDKLIQLEGYSLDLKTKTDIESRQIMALIRGRMLESASSSLLGEEIKKDYIPEEAFKKLLTGYYKKVEKTLDKLVEKDRQDLLMNVSSRAVIQKLLKDLDILANNPPTIKNIMDTKKVLQGLECIVETLLSMKRKDRIAL